MNNDTKDRRLTPAQRDEQERTRQDALYEQGEMIVSDSNGSQLQLFGPTLLLEQVALIFAAYTQLTKQFERRPTSVIRHEFGVLLREEVAKLPKLGEIELRDIHVPCDRGQLYFRLVFKHADYGRWNLELPPVTSGSLICLDPNDRFPHTPAMAMLATPSFGRVTAVNPGPFSKEFVWTGTGPAPQVSDELEQAAERTVRIDYTNYRGERSWKRIQPMQVGFGKTEYHPTPQWLLQAVDVDRLVPRFYAMKDIHAWSEDAPPKAEAERKPLNWTSAQPLSVSIADLMEAAGQVSSMGHLNGTTNWGANMMTVLKRMSNKI